jgi:hypothetical protein
MEGEGFVFRHVPKTGGTWAVKAMAAAGVSLRALTADNDGHGIPGRLAPNDRFAFAFVREPFDWYRSFWAHRNQFGDWSDIHPLDPLARASFDAFLNRVCDLRPGYLSRVYEQYVGVPDRAISFIGRFERLADDLVLALREAGVAFDEARLRRVRPTNCTALRPECAAVTRERLLAAESVAVGRFYSEKSNGLPPGPRPGAQSSASGQPSLVRPSVG